MNKGIKTTLAIGAGYVAVKWTLILLVGGALYKSGYWNNWYLLFMHVIG
jgi:general stress protein CsbA